MRSRNRYPLVTVRDHGRRDHLESSHAAFIKQLPEFARHLPYQVGTTGIVTTAGASSFGQAVSLVLLTRQTGSQLPIQIVLDSTAPWIDFLCANEMPRHDAACLYINDMWTKLYPFITVKFERFQWKSIALVASTFQNVLFLDSDCLPILNPDRIFEKGAEPFTSAGFITWPDFWASSTSAMFYRVAGDIEVPPLTSRATSESGVIVYDKARHADTLLLAVYYNYNGPGRYYTMLTQHGPGEGDKETFFQAALVLDALREKGVYNPPTEWMKPGVGVKKGYWDVKTMPQAHGRTAKGNKWRGMFMQQMDPMEDYRAVMAAVKEAADNTPSDKATRSKHDDHPPPPRRFWPFTNLFPKTTPQKTNPDDPNNPSTYLTNSTFLSATGNLTTTPDTARFMFFHHNGVKPDFTRLRDATAGMQAEGDDGRRLRMWGDPAWIVARTGRDVEKLWWEASLEVYCQPGVTRWLGAVCEEMRRVWGRVYE
ncbi:mannosyltransferase putative-domain-containing protein [Chaetomium fimeti]|uniref:Mannosyltransferase putative-domain-containing protein n=1 Tax=Chaetomium fimeti TaxID=1854472 RepID=A0AAE0H5T5_9PEZI|nr:mannosyltransferase putative-domain-containing protein [Chaetomium fimeti]